MVAAGEEGIAWVKVWMGDSALALGLWPHGNGAGGGLLARMMGAGCGHSRCGLVAAGLQQAVGWGLAVPLTRIWTPSHPGPVGCWLDISREATVAGPGPGGSTDHRGCWLSTHDTHSSRPLSSRSRQLFILMIPKSQTSGKNGDPCGGHSMSTGVGRGRQRYGHAAWLRRAEPAPSSPALQDLS